MKTDCKHNWKVFNTVKEYAYSGSSTALHQTEYAYWSCDKCLTVKKVKVL